MKDMLNLHYCKKHTIPKKMYAVRVALDNMVIGYWCAFCGNFVPLKNLVNLHFLQQFVEKIEKGEVQLSAHTN